MGELLRSEDPAATASCTALPQQEIRGREISGVDASECHMDIFAETQDHPGRSLVEMRQRVEAVANADEADEIVVRTEVGDGVVAGLHGMESEGVCTAIASDGVVAAAALDLIRGIAADQGVV